MMRDIFSDRQRLIELLRNHSVRKGKFVLSSGRTTNFYIDARVTTMSPEGLALIGRLAIDVLTSRNWKPDAVGGLTLGADPIAYSISYTSNLQPPLIRAFTVRKEAKGHGTGKVIEGPFQRDDHVVIVEDVITTGASTLRAIEAVTRAQGQILGVLALLDREEGGRIAIENAGYEVIPIVNLKEVLT